MPRLSAAGTHLTVLDLGGLGGTQYASGGIRSRSVRGAA